MVKFNKKNQGNFARLVSVISANAADTRHDGGACVVLGFAASMQCTWGGKWMLYTTQPQQRVSNSATHPQTYDSYIAHRLQAITKLTASSQVLCQRLLQPLPLFVDVLGGMKQDEVCV